MDTKHFVATLNFKDMAEGEVIAAFSVFNEKDSDGDVVLPSFFTSGQDAPMAAWGHDWGSLPPGRGTILTTPTHAEFHGRFFVNTTHGRDTYLTVKEMAGLQEWSFGFRILDAESGEMGGERVRFLKRGEVYEVSPVLVGANRNTQTLFVKSGQSFEAQIEAALAAVLDVAERTKSLADLRAKEGRAISTARRERLAAFPPMLRDVADNLDGMLEETAPPEKGAVPNFLATALAARADLARLATSGKG